MKKLIVVTALLIASVAPVSAETVRTCSSVYGGGEVCGETTANTTVEHKVVETGASDNQMINLLLRPLPQIN
jgi:hypothetical protein